MGWGQSAAATEESTPKYGRKHMRAVFERQKARQNRTPVRMALVGKENTCKTGLALDLANTDKIITIFDIDNSALETVSHLYPKAKNINVVSLYDETDESIFNEDNTTNWVSLVEKVGWFVNLLSEDIQENPDAHGAVIFDGGSTFMKWCEFAMTGTLLKRGVIKEEGDSFNQKEWRTRNQLFRDIINRVHGLSIDKVFFTFHLKDHKTYVDVGGGSKGLMKIGEKVDSSQFKTILAVLLLLVGIAIAYDTFIKEEKITETVVLSSDTVGPLSEFILNFSKDMPIFYGLTSVLLAVILGVGSAMIRNTYSKWNKKREIKLKS